MNDWISRASVDTDGETRGFGAPLRLNSGIAQGGLQQSKGRLVCRETKQSSWQ